MSGYLQIIAGALVAVILVLTLSAHRKDISVLLGIGACCMVLCAAVSYLEPVVDFISTLQDIGGMDGNWMGIMLKAVGIGLIAEIASLICNDSGSSALGKTVQILAASVVIWISIPLMTQLLELVQRILGDI